METRGQKLEGIAYDGMGHGCFGFRLLAFVGLLLLVECSVRAGNPAVRSCTFQVNFATRCEIARSISVQRMLGAEITAGHHSGSLRPEAPHVHVASGELQNGIASSSCTRQRACSVTTKLLTHPL